MDIGRPTLDQLGIFIAVVDCGGFSAAARRLGRAVSAISYGIAAMEAQLGVTLFDREGSRRPILTLEGKAILAHARTVHGEVDELVAGLRARAAGLEAELALAVDVMCPLNVVSAVLREFQQAHPTVNLTLHVDGLGAVASLLLDERVQLAVGGPTIAAQRELELLALGEIDLIPVAAPAHPLARMATIPPGTARRWRQLILTDRSSLTEGKEFGVMAANTWRLADLGAKHALLLEGVGWGNMPRPMVAEDLASGRLVHLAVPEAPRTGYPLCAAWRSDCRPGPAGQWLLEALQERLGAAATL